MNEIPVAGGMLDAVVGELAQSPLFSELPKNILNDLSKGAKMMQYDNGETIMTEGSKSDCFYVIASGEVSVKAKHSGKGELVEIARVKSFETIGEIGMILGHPRSATVTAGPDTILLKLDQKFFSDMFHKVPEFSMLICKVLAKRLQTSSSNIAPPAHGPVSVEKSAATLLPIEFIQRHRVLPLKTEGNVLHIGFVHDPTPEIISSITEMLPGMSLRPTAIDAKTFDAQLKNIGGAPSLAAAPKKDEAGESELSVKRESPKLDQMLRRMVAERASDLHLSSGLKPHWRIDGSIHEIADAPVLKSQDIIALVEPILAERNKEQFKEDNDTDFAYAIPDVARFRVNMFCDNKGPGLVFRQIPDKILTIEQLGLPPTVRQLCDNPKGLILVTGPTGSGKSTTLAAMIDHVNKTRDDHIITMEDPIEFVHRTQNCLVNQREVGPHTKSFSRALRAALREDPDIVLVGEMRDLETVQLAIEVANTGHLVFGTLHTNTAVSTVSRIIDMFPAAQQNQVRTVLADTLKGVVAQTLCKKIGGGRVAALEIMVSDTGVSNLIREGKTQMLMSAMQTGRAKGNRVLNEELARLVKEKVITQDEAMGKAVDKPDLATKLGITIKD